MSTDFYLVCPETKRKVTIARESGAASMYITSGSNDLVEDLIPFYEGYPYIPFLKEHQGKALIFLSENEASREPYCDYQDMDWDDYPEWQGKE